MSGSRRGLALTSILVVLLQTTIASGEPAEWSKSLKPMGWALVTRTSDRIVYARPGPEANQLWLRREYRTHEHGVGSAMTLEEFDCAAQRSRGLRLMAFKENNLAKPMFSATLVLSSSAESWTDVAPGTYGEEELNTACSERRGGESKRD